LFGFLEIVERKHLMIFKKNYAKSKEINSKKNKETSIVALNFPFCSAAKPEV